jgi:hypothetical protein
MNGPLDRGALEARTTPLYNPGAIAHPNTPDLGSALRCRSLEPGTRTTQIPSVLPFPAMLSPHSLPSVVHPISAAISGRLRGGVTSRGCHPDLRMLSLEGNAGTRCPDDLGLEGVPGEHAYTLVRRAGYLATSQRAASAKNLNPI